MQKIEQPTPPFARAVSNGLELRVKVVPGASRTQFAGILGERLKIRVAAAPERGKANHALIAFVSRWLTTNQVELIAGHTAAEKTLLVRGRSSLDPAQLAAIGA
jgi:uncharacterized protein